MFGVLTDWLMPYHPFTRLMIFNIFWSSSLQILKREHHSSGNTGPTSSPLDHSAVSLSKQTDIVHSEGCQLDSCDIVRYTDQCCIALRGQSEFSIIGDLLMLPRAFKNLGLQKLRFYLHLILLHFRICYCNGTARSSLISSTTREQDEKSLLRPWILESTFCLQ